MTERSKKTSISTCFPPKTDAQRNEIRKGGERTHDDYSKKREDRELREGKKEKRRREKRRERERGSHTCRAETENRKKRGWPSVEGLFLFRERREKEREMGEEKKTYISVKAKRGERGREKCRTSHPTLAFSLVSPPDSE